mmetsp:Transcript_3323/g.5830  ORF Transcript_3323/g.5830 Transcript_3323/m.5830 type:complete len:157 (-) Transcript_3323:18-488(-)
MILTILIVSYTNGGVIYARFFGPKLREEPQQAVWLERIRHHTAPEWGLLTSDHTEQTAYMDECAIMFKRIGDVVFIVVGNREHDAMLLLEFGRAFEQCVRTIYKIPENNQKLSVEKRILGAYWTVCLILDEMIDDGSIDHLDPQIVLRMINMKPNK